MRLPFGAAATKGEQSGVGKTLNLKLKTETYRGGVAFHESWSLPP